MKRFYLYREYLPEATIGEWIEEGKYNPICRTLERPNLNNQRDNPKTKENESSCIPEGEYLVDYTYSQRFKKKTFIITGVKNRDGIRIHAANTVDELFGCIAPALFFKNNVKHTNDKVYTLYACSSGETLKNLEKYILEELNLKQFTLCITSDLDIKKIACKVNNEQIINQNGAL